MRSMGGGIYVETGYRRVNVAAIETDEGFILIDTPPYPEDARDWKAKLAELSKKPVQFIINTDHHRDRIIGNGWFDAPIVAHRAAAEEMLSLEQTFMHSSAEELARGNGELIELANLKLVPPHVSYQETMHLVKKGRKVTLTHMPGATAGSTWIEFIDEKVLFVGDHVVTNTHPFLADAVSKAWLEALNWLRRDRFEGFRIVPGRGGVTKSATSIKVSNYVGAARRRVRGKFRSGRPRSELVTLVDGLLPDFPYDRGNRSRIERRIRSGLEHIYDEMKLEESE